jgi:hypothetical protein
VREPARVFNLPETETSRQKTPMGTAAGGGGGIIDGSRREIVRLEVMVAREGLEPPTPGL